MQTEENKLPTDPRLGLSGVYAITHIASGKRYIGSASVTFKGRWKTHRDRLRASRHHSRYLQAAWNKYGERAFVFSVIKVTEPSEAVEYEQSFIDFYKSADRRHGYNLCPMAGSVRGVKHTEETKAKWAELRTGKKHSEDARSNMSAAHRGKKLTDATKAKLAVANTGKKASEETKAKMSKSQKAAMTDERRAKIGDFHRGKTMSDSAREKIAEYGRQHRDEVRNRLVTANLGRTVSDETRAKMSVRKKGKPLTQEHRTNMSESHKRRWARIVEQRGQAITKQGDES